MSGRLAVFRCADLAFGTGGDRALSARWSGSPDNESENKRPDGDGQELRG